MNPFVCIMLIFATIGLIDKILDNKFGLASAFDKGIITMGDFMLSISGFYCISIAFLRNNTEILNHLGDFLFFDPSILIGSLLAPDLGGYSIVEMISKDPNMIVFAGVLLTSTIGATISFQLPIFLNNLEKDDVPSFMQGIAYGLIVLPIVLILVGLFLQIDSLMINMIPLLVLCILLLFMFFINLKLSVKILTIFANMIRILGYLFFFLVCLTFFFDFGFTQQDLIQEVFSIVFQMTLIVAGSLVLCQLILKYFSLQIEKLATMLHINQYALIGLILSLGTSIAMMPLFSKMDTKGKLINAAFSVSGAYVFGGQLGFIASVSNSFSTTIFIIAKLSAGILAILMVYLFTKRRMEN